ncbi:hypothetical protein DRJ22_01220 [Candidatus Woesearchaeota archaeon]|nr:MAG: hypothetical protein B6U93_01790 [Candidatus Woesearchaeota archaeon ex4484_78]RLE46716.1 MAG: hypothetical protein DRJ22_01220 [Candidatus Woesearchaeota archaeon]
MLDKINLINKGLEKKFGKEDPFRIMTRLLEECGELAQQVNHFEGSGLKQLKMGEPNKQKLAKEVQDVIRCVMQIVDHYQLQKELKESIDKSIKELGDEKLL